ncbi:MAG: PIN domain-containing protein [Planctomycetia bacterium]|nr:PIN domain-containing protein [Planctomycetia bacterium]
MGTTLIYLDANVIIRLVEGDVGTRTPLEQRLAPSIGMTGSLTTSQLSRLECRTKPLRALDHHTLKQFDMFFAGLEITLIEVSASVIDQATDLRAKYNLKTPDALHYASAIDAGASVFLTGDLTFSRCQEIPVEVL